jgi:monofunctional biosynthetic peptidoglycan transglycosylase
MRSVKKLARAALGATAVVAAVLGYEWVCLPDVRPLRTRNPTSTAFMTLRASEAAAEGRAWQPAWRWTSYSRISSSLKRAVIVTEDAGFWGHDGVDLKELRISIEDSLRRGVAPRGASTITQQLAKNLYLSPSYNPVRKLVELMIARRLEAELTKTRIFEIYLNVIEWGDGVWGAEAAARRYFGKSAADLNVEESALLAGAIINPRIYTPSRPNARLLRRKQIILGRLGVGPTRAERLESELADDPPDDAAGPTHIDIPAEGAAGR